jgi:hypothetical protein
MAHRTLVPMKPRHQAVIWPELRQAAGGIRYPRKPRLPIVHFTAVRGRAGIAGAATGIAMSTLQRKLGQLFRGLWRDADFMKLWASLTITSFGAQVTNLALPLTAALLLAATPWQMGVLVALETLPFALVSLHAGV